MKAVQFGAGNIGRGFLGQLYFQSGYETTFVDVVEETVRLLNERKSYPLRIVDEDTYTLTISNVAAIHASQTDAVSAALAEADIAATAVGVPVLSKVAPAIATGLRRRFIERGSAPLNIIVCENMIGAGPFLRDRVKASLAPEFHHALDENVGFVEASIGRMVPVMTPELRAEDPLLICAEAYCELPVERDAFKGAIPPLAHLAPKGNFGAYVERKLFIHNAGHAATAYLGHLRGHEFIWQAIADTKVEHEVLSSLEEAEAGLVAKHGLEPGELHAHALDIVRRFHNRALGDQVERVARDPLRKLGPNDRLIGAAKLCMDFNVAPPHLAFAVAAAIRYDNSNDPAAAMLHELRREKGARGVLNHVCELAEDSPLTNVILEQEQRLYEEGWIKQE